MPLEERKTLPFRLSFQAFQWDLADQMGPGENIKIIKNTSIEGRKKTLTYFDYRPRPQYADEILKRSFISTARPSVHTNLVSSAAAIRVVTQRFSPTNG